MASREKEGGSCFIHVCLYKSKCKWSQISNCSLMMLYTGLGTSRIRCSDKSLARILYYFVMVITYIWSLFTQLGTLIICIKALLSHQIFASNGWNEKNLSMARIFFVKDLLFFYI